MEKVLVVGLGKIGKPIYELVEKSGKYKVYGYDLDPAKTVHKLEEIPGDINILHITIQITAIVKYDFSSC